MRMNVVERSRTEKDISESLKWGSCAHEGSLQIKLKGEKGAELRYEL